MVNLKLLTPEIPLSLIIEDKRQIIAKWENKPHYAEFKDHVQEYIALLKRAKPMSNGQINSPEQVIPELWIYEELSEKLIGWRLEPGFHNGDCYDFVILSNDGLYTFTIELKTKPESADYYIFKYDNPNTIDRSPTIPSNEEDRLFKADFVIWSRISEFGKISSKYLDSSCCIDGISTKDTLQKHMFKQEIKNDSVYKYLDYLTYRTQAFKYVNTEGLTKFIEYLNQLTRGEQ